MKRFFITLLLPLQLTFSSLFIGMVCEAVASLIYGRRSKYLSVPSSSGWCVKLIRSKDICARRRSLSVPSSSGWCVKLIRGEVENGKEITFQFPLHRDGV